MKKLLIFAVLPMTLLAATQIIVTNETTFEFVNQRGFTMPRSNSTPVLTPTNVASGYDLTFEVGVKLGYKLAKSGGSLDDISKLTEAYRTNDYAVAEALFRNPKDPCESHARQGVSLGWIARESGLTREQTLRMFDSLSTNINLTAEEIYAIIKKDAK